MIHPDGKITDDITLASGNRVGGCAEHNKSALALLVRGGLAAPPP